MGAMKKGVSLTIDAVCKSYGDVQVLKRIALNIEGGKALTLLGPSGCGKSTLLRIIAGFVRADAGDVRLDGQSILPVPPNRRETAMVFQSYTLFPHMSVIDNVTFGLKMRQVGRSQALQRAAEALEMVKLSHLADRYPSQLSGGQMQRVALARALVTEPRILLLDEPFGALDKNLREEMQVELRKLQTSLGVTSVCVTHDQQEAMVISDYIAVMNDGQVAQFGTPLDIYDTPQSEFVARFMGGSNIVRADVIKTQESRCALQVGDGRAFQAYAGAAAMVSERKAVALAIKPRALQIMDMPPEGTHVNGCMTVSGVVSNQVLLGDSIAYEISLPDGNSMLAEVARDRGTGIHPVGKSVWLYAPGEACVVLEDGINA